MRPPPHLAAGKSGPGRAQGWLFEGLTPRAVIALFTAPGGGGKSRAEGLSTWCARTQGSRSYLRGECEIWAAAIKGPARPRTSARAGERVSREARAAAAGCAVGGGGPVGKTAARPRRRGFSLAAQASCRRPGNNVEGAAAIVGGISMLKCRSDHRFINPFSRAPGCDGCYDWHCDEEDRYIRWIAGRAGAPMGG